MYYNCSRLILCLFTRKRCFYFVCLLINKLGNIYYLNEDPSRIEYVYNVVHFI